MKLEELQKRLIHFITDPETQDADFSLIKAQKNISPKERLGSYRKSCLNRLVESFKSDFEVSLCFIGEERFEKLAHQYLHLNPSQTHYINELGKGFSAYLKEKVEPSDTPFLVELIDLEWRMVESFYDFSKRGETGTSSSGLWVNPSLIFISSPWPLDKVWDEKKTYPAEETLFVSWSHMDRVSHTLRLSQIEFLVLKSLFQTRSLEQAVEALNERFSEEELLPVFQGSLSGWIEMGLIKLEE